MPNSCIWINCVVLLCLSINICTNSISSTFNQSLWFLVLSNIMMGVYENKEIWLSEIKRSHLCAVTGAGFQSALSVSVVFFVVCFQCYYVSRQ